MDESLIKQGEFKRMIKNQIFPIVSALSLTLITSCAYNPVGVVSKLDADTYSVTTYGRDAAFAANLANLDAKGICKDKHKTEYFKVISQEDIDMSKNNGAGLAGAIGNLIAGSKQNNKCTLTFRCN